MSSTTASPLPLDWLISLKDPRSLWSEHWFSVVFEVLGAILLYQVFKHAKRQGESHYLVLAAMISTACFEILPLCRPGYELWWYHSGIVNIWKQRLPSYVISLFAITHYLADRTTKHTNLPRVTRAFASSVLGILLMSPFLWMAPRLLLLTYHFDDPVFKDGLAGIPYIQLLVLMLLFFHTSHLYDENCEELQPHERNPYNYTWCAFQSGIVAAMYTIVEQYVLYILIKLTIGFNTGFCLLAALAIMMYLSNWEIKTLQVTSISTTDMLQPLRQTRFWAIAAGLIFLTVLPLCLNIGSLKSTGQRLEMGPCHVTHEMSNTSPLEITRRRFLCPEDTKSLNFDFHCLEQSEVLSKVQNNEKDYTICGKDMPRYLQKVYVLAMYSSFCLFIVHNLLRVSFTFKFQQKSAIPSKKVV